VSVAAQIDLFAAGARSPMLRDEAPPVIASAARATRPYQETAIANVRRELAGNRSTLLVLPTGTGKTYTAARVMAAWPGNVLWCAHRDELLNRETGAARDLEAVCGELVSFEQAEQRSDGSRIVVASVPTLRGDRLARFMGRHRPTLIVFDEAHHAVADTYRAIERAAPEAKLLGLTATPDRADARAMGQVFESVAFVYEILDAIRDGYLVRVRQFAEHVDEIDLSGVGTVAGDLNQGQLDVVMAAEKVLHGIVEPTVRRAGDRPTIAFFTSVEAAHRAAEIFNRYKPDQARAVDGTTATDTRKRLFRDFKAGVFQYLCNVGIATEGVDLPPTACIAMGRPTSSRSLYAQCIGRGLRLSPGKVDCLVIDFVGNSGRHKLVTAKEVLGGRYDDEVKERAQRKIDQAAADGKDILTDEALEEAQRERDAERARQAIPRGKVKARVRSTSVEVDPFELLDLPDPEADTRYAPFRAEASDNQKNALRRMGVPFSEGISKRQAHALLEARIGKATLKMVTSLQKAGVERVRAMDMTFDQARPILDAWTRNGWRRLSPQWLGSLLEREPGSDG
jgi:superfamily II DNA or RNA helicase